MACREPNTRKLWGCDRVANPPAYDIDCWTCGARPGEMGSCATCGGEGAILLDRCPSAILDRTLDGQDAFHMVEAYVRYKDGYLPAAGGMMDQARTFDVALGHMAHLWAHHERINSDKGERMRVLNEKMAAVRKTANG